ncbi:MAG: Crp/Fnr family transcriptional regulator [Saprospiraceae bacterium]|nr:Crp/Fnr family transcriptional regulator [Saprospiraceae bacterium]
MKLFSDELINEIYTKSKIIDVPAGTQILRLGQYVKVLPIVLSGRVKVFAYGDEKEFLLYYIKENESCIMSFSALLNNDVSKICAITEDTTTILTLPGEDVLKWTKKFPEFNHFYLKYYQHKYDDLLETLRQVVFEKLDTRILKYLSERSKISGNEGVRVTHKEISSDLGTSREVVTRIIKKLETEQYIKIEKNFIKIL